MRPKRVVFFAPDRRDAARFEQIGENLTLQALVAHLAVEAFVVSILPRPPRFDKAAADVRLPQPTLQARGDELRTVVTAHVPWSAVLKDGVTERFNDRCAVQAMSNHDGDAVARVLVEDWSSPEKVDVASAVICWVSLARV